MKKKILISVLLCVFLLSVFCVFSFAYEIPNQASVVVPYVSSGSFEVLFADGNTLAFMLPSVTNIATTSQDHSYGSYQFGTAPYKVDVYVSTLLDENGQNVYDILITPTAKKISSISFYCTQATIPQSSERPMFSYFPVAYGDGDVQNDYAGVWSLSSKVHYQGKVLNFQCANDAKDLSGNYIGTTSRSVSFDQSFTNSIPFRWAGDVIGMLYGDSIWHTDPDSFMRSYLTSYYYSDSNISKLYKRSSKYIELFGATVSFNDSDQNTHLILSDDNMRVGFGFRFDGYSLADGPKDFGFINTYPNVQMDENLGFWSILLNDASAFFNISLFTFGGIRFTLGACLMFVFVFAIGIFVLRMLR